MEETADPQKIFTLILMVVRKSGSHFNQQFELKSFVYWLDNLKHSKAPVFIDSRGFLYYRRSDNHHYNSFSLMGEGQDEGDCLLLTTHYSFHCFSKIESHPK